jgi:large subunit ribosomal protein L31
MKPGIHPNYRYVVFQDTSSGDTILTKSTIETEETTTWTDGNEYPLAKVEISAFTHPFFTGQMKIVDTAGRVERFEKRYGKRRKAAVTTEEAPAAEETPEAPVAEEAPVVEETPEAPAAEESAPEETAPEAASDETVDEPADAESE